MSKFILLAASLAAPTAMSEPFTQLLTSTSRNTRVENWDIDRARATPDCPANWSVRKYVLHGGKQEGVDVIVVDNGKIQIAISPTRGMGILAVTAGDLRLGWDSPVKEIVHPRHVNLQSRGGLGWLEGFNEFVVRCGLESMGHPGTDRFVNNVGDEATMELTLHGKIANIPASEVEVSVERQAPYRIRVRGRVDERMFYGPKLELWTELSTEPGSAAFRITDTITNHGGAEQEFQILYHTNFGQPLLEGGATFLTAAQQVMPLNDHAAEGVATYASYAAPKLGFVEQVYCIKPLAGPDGKAVAMLQNAKKDRAVTMAFSLDELPYLTLWKNTNALAEGYVTGLEPGTGYPYNRRIERKAGRVPKLAANATRSFTIDFTIHADAQSTKAAAEKITALQATHPAKIDEKPAKVE